MKKHIRRSNMENRQYLFTDFLSVLIAIVLNMLGEGGKLNQ